jgi:hypothetical protein
MTTTIDVPALQPHPGQQRIVEEASRFNVLACGRRWGKTDFGVDLCIDLAAEGHPVGWFAPNYKFLEDAWNVMYQTLEPAYGKHLRANKSERRMQLAGGGVVEFWSTQPAQAGDDESMVARGRKYKRIVYDEAAHARRLKADWTRAIRATLSDYRGDAWFFSTPKGQNYFHRLWVRGQTGEDDWASWQMPTAMNPFIHPDEIEAARRDMPADAFSQEYEAEFLADAANPFGVDAIRACTPRSASTPSGHALETPSGRARWPSGAWISPSRRTGRSPSASTTAAMWLPTSDTSGTGGARRPT